MSNTPILDQAIQMIHLSPNGQAANLDEVIAWLEAQGLYHFQAIQVAAKAARRARWKIAPHKGGRDGRLEVRIRGELKDRLYEVARERGVSVADLVEEWVIRL